MKYAITPDKKIHQVVNEKQFYEENPQAQDVTALPNIYKEFCKQKEAENLGEKTIKINKPFWAIVKHGEPEGFDSGKSWVEITLIQCDTASELNDSLADGSVHAGESMGAYFFEVLALSHKNLNQLQYLEEQEAQK